MAGPKGLSNASGSVTLALKGGVVTGTIELSPNNQRGVSQWNVTGLIVQTSRPGLAPTPRFQVYKNYPTPDNSLGLTYDGSYATGKSIGETVNKGEKLIFVFTGGQVGDVAYVTLSGTAT